MAGSRGREEPADELAEWVPGRWDGDDEAEPGLLGFVGVPDTPTGRHALESGRIGRTFSAAGLPAVALGVAVLAGLVAVVSLLVGIVVVSRMDDSRKAAVRAAPEPSIAPSEAVAPPQPVAPLRPPAPPPTTAPPTAIGPSSGPPSSSQVFAPAYADQLLRVPRNTCDGTPVDLDEPVVLPAAGAADLNYRTCEDGPHLDLDATAGFAVVDVPGAGPQDCRDALRANPGVGWLTPDQSLTVCVLTSTGAAAVQHIPQRLVRLHVDAIDSDGALTLSLTAWNLPAVGP